MNELIRELIEQATKRYPATESSGEFSTFDKEKFVHLIIQECMNMCDAEKADYTKYRKNAWDREEKEIYAEGEAACDTVKHRMKYGFEIK